jgi:hypothetical protein
MKCDLTVVLTAVAMKNIISCYVKSCSSLQVKQCFEGRYSLLLQCRRYIKQLKKKKYEAFVYHVSDREYGGNRLHSVTLHKKELFVAVLLILYGPECWTLTKEQRRRTETAVMIS